MESLFKSEQGKQEILQLYDQKLESLAINYTYRIINTGFGKTNIITAGNSQNPPMILIHGSNGCAPLALEIYQNLLDSFYLYAVDVLAQPNKSSETRLSMNDDSYGQWMNEIINELNLKEVYLAGFSFGGLVILKTLIHNESKIKEVFLTAPAFVVNGNQIKALFKFFIPMKRFIKTKKKDYLEQFLSCVFTEKDDFAQKSLALVFTYFRMDFTPIPIIKKIEALKIHTPITIIAAEDDIIFPGVKMIKRAKKIFPSLQNTVLLKNSKHVQNKKDNAKIAEIIKEKTKEL